MPTARSATRSRLSCTASTPAGAYTTAKLETVSAPTHPRRPRAAGAELRRQRLARLLQHVASLQRAAEENSAAVAALLETERVRHFTPQERDALRALRWRAEALSLELRGAHAEFEALRGQPS